MHSADLQPGQPVRVTGRGHLSRCGTVAFSVDEDESSEAEVWIDFGDSVIMPVDRCMIEPIALTDERGLTDPVVEGLEALHTSWRGPRPTQPGKADGWRSASR